MKAITREEYGESGVLRLAAAPVPEPGPGEVRVRVRAAGVNMADWHLMTGRPAIMRLATGLRAPRQPGLGQDVAGVVEAVGAGVTRFAPGDAVLGIARAAFAELAVAKERLLVPKPAAASFEQAAVMPLAGYTALQALRPVGVLERRHVAVTGAGGGVGSMLVQLAVARGARVTAVCSAGKAEFVRRLGAHDVVDYRETDVTTGPVRFDAVLDFAGGRPVRDWRRVLRPRAVLVLGGDETDGAGPLGPLGRSLRGALARGIRVVTLVATDSPDDIAEVARLLESGELRSPLTRSYPLAEAARAIDDLRAARHPGKLALVP